MQSLLAASQPRQRVNMHCPVSSRLRRRCECDVYHLIIIFNFPSSPDRSHRLLLSFVQWLQQLQLHFWPTLPPSLGVNTKVLIFIGQKLLFSLAQALRRNNGGEYSEKLCVNRKTNKFSSTSDDDDFHFPKTPDNAYLLSTKVISCSASTGPLRPSKCYCCPLRFRISCLYRGIVSSAR